MKFDFPAIESLIIVIIAGEGAYWRLGKVVSDFAGSRCEERKHYQDLTNTFHTRLCGVEI